MVYWKNNNGDYPIVGYWIILWGLLFSFFTRETEKHHPITKNMFLNNQQLWACLEPCHENSINQHPKYRDNHFADWSLLVTKIIQEFVLQIWQNISRPVLSPSSLQNAPRLPICRTSDESGASFGFFHRGGKQKLMFHDPSCFMANMFRPTRF